MVDKKNKNLKKLLSIKNIVLLLVVVLSALFFVFNGFDSLKSVIINSRKMFDDNEKIDGKELNDVKNDGTYQLSLSVTGDAETDTRVPHANILIIYDQSGSMLAHLPSSTGSYGHTGSLQSSGWHQLYKTRTRHVSFGGEYYTCSNPLEDGESYSGTLYYDSNGNSTGGCTSYSGNRYLSITRADSAEKTVYDFSNALLSKNPTSGPDTDAVEMALVTFNTNSPPANTSDPAQGWTSNKSTFTGLFDNTGTSHRRTYQDLTNWEQALTKARSVLEDADGDPTFVIFVTDGAPTVYQLANGKTSSKVDDPIEAYPYAKTPAYNINHFKTQDGQNNGSVVATGGNTTLYGVYAFGNEADYLDDLIYYAKDGRSRPVSEGGETSQTVETTNYYNAADSSALTSSLAEIFNSIVDTVGLGEAFIQDGTTQKVETSTGDISTLLEVDETSFEYWLEFPVTNNKITRVDPLSGTEYEITLRKDETTGKIIASSTYWGENSDIEVEGELGVGTFKYKWESANKLYNFDPPAATFDKYDPETNPNGTGKVDWPLGKVEKDGEVVQKGVGTLLDGVKYTVTFDVYPSQETYDYIAQLENGEIEYNDLDARIRDYLVDNGNGTYSLRTNTTATLTYTDTRNGNTTPTTKTYNNPDPVATDASDLNVEKVWLNELDWRSAPANTTLAMNLIRDGVDTGLTINVNSDNNWTNSRAIATGLLRTKVDGEGKTHIQVLDRGHDYTLSEPEIISDDFQTYRWEMTMETAHPMIINGELTTLVLVEDDEVPAVFNSNSGEYDASVDYLVDGNRHYYKICKSYQNGQCQNPKIYYDKEIGSHLNAYNNRKSNFNFIKKVLGDAVGGEEFEFKFKINDANINESLIDTIEDASEIRDNYSTWFSVCDTKVDPTCVSSASLVRNLDTDANAEEGNTGYYYANDNSVITVKLKDGWNVRVTNIGTGSTYQIIESKPESPFELTDIQGELTISVPELPVNAVQVSDGVYQVGQTTYTRVEETDGNGKVTVHYEYTYTPDIDVPTRTTNGTIVAPNTSYEVIYTNTYPKTHLTATKEWHGGDKPVEVTLYRSVNGGAKQLVPAREATTEDEGFENPVSLNAENSWTHTFKDLDLTDANNNVYEYFVEESPLDGTYETIYSGTEDIVISAISNPENAEELRVGVSLTGNDASTNEEEEVTLTEANNWQVVLEGKNYLNPDGSLKTVSIHHDSLATIRYFLTNRQNTIVNEEKTTVEGQKTWDDAENQDGIRPTSITINLFADGEKIDFKTVTANDNNWSWKWENLPKYKAVTVTDDTTGETSITYQEIIYSVTEETVTNYQSGITENTDYSITNKHDPFNSIVTIEKTWSDEHDQDGIRPDSITLVLKDNNNMIIKDGNSDYITLTKESGWKYTVTLPRRAEGNDLVYTVSDVTIDGVNISEVGPAAREYTATISEPVASTTPGTDTNQTILLSIDNSHTPEEIELSGTKTWNDANNQDGIRPETITVTLYADGTPVPGKTLTIDANSADTEGKWVYNFGKLPKYASKTDDNQEAREIVYTVRENDLTNIGYVATYDDGKNLDIINTHIPETTILTGTKDWSDNNDQDGLRPDSITIQLLADGNPVEGKTVTISPDEDGNWPEYSFGNLPKYKNDTLANSTAREIVYTVTDTVSGYTASYADGVLTNTHPSETTTVSGSKTWADNNDQDGLRPESITIHLLADGVEKESKTVTAEDGWTWSFPDLPKYRDHGTAIVYTINETGVDTNDYDIEVIGTDVKNTHIPETTDVSGSKTWADDDDQDGLRPESIIINLLADGKKIDDRTVTAENGWAWSFPDLPKYRDHGTEIVYTVTEEMVTGYEPKVEGFDVTNTHTPFTDEITILKEWNDDGNRDNKRPDSITVILKDNNGIIIEDVEGSKSITLDAAHNWTTTVTVPRRAGGQDLTYTIQEVGIETAGYTAEVLDPIMSTTVGTDSNQTIKLQIKNNREFETVDVEGSKTWADNDDQDGNRPDFITIHLLADGVEKESKTVTAEDGWAWSWTDLPKYLTGEVGQAIVYTITEDPVEGYDSQVNGYNVTNTYEPEKTGVAGSKTWADNNDQDGNRPESITIHLLADGVEKESKTVTAEDGWAWTFPGLPKYRDHGTEIVYTITEDEVEGYSSQVNGYNVTNTYEPEKTLVAGSKTWADNNDQDGNRPETITINLLADGEQIDSTTVTAEDGWAWTFPGLPKYRDHGTEIVYTITENEVEGYTSVVEGFNVTNTYEPEKTEVNGSKTWADNNDQDGNRPESITINLLADGEQIDSTTVTAEDGWAWTFPGLPKYRDHGTEIVYTITEDEVEGYESEVEGFNATNTYEPEKTEVAGSKTWADNNDQDGNRPESITIHLLADGVEKESKTVTAEDGWAWSFPRLPKYRDQGTEIVYTITEDEVEGYESKVEGFNATNTYEPEKTIVAGSKTWADDDDQDGLRPESIIINLLADGKKIDDRTVTAKDGWAWSFPDLPKYRDHGTEIVYTVTEEMVTGYEPKVEGFDVTNTHTPFTDEITILKEWNDDGNRDNKRPDSITVILKDNNGIIIEDVEGSKSITLDAAHNWTTTVTVPRRAGGQDLTYTIQEVGLVTAGYTAEVLDPIISTSVGTDSNQTIKLQIKNNREFETVDVEGSKTWKDAGDQDGLRPESITIHLLADGVEKESKTVTAEDNWSWSWTDLPKYLTGEVGQEIVYTITEDPVEGYASVVEGFDVTNTYEPETTDVSGSKTWADADDQDGNRPESITINLLADGEQIDSTTVTEDDGWAWTFPGLPKYRDHGTEIVYTITEEEVEGYTSVVEGFNVTNTYEPEKTEVIGSKTWADADDQDGNRPESITINLLADGEQINSQTVTAEEKWVWSFKNLPKYRDHGTEIVYTITEDEVEGYDSEVKGFNITNTHNPEKTEVAGSKTWADNNDQDGLRPESITVNLLADGTKINSQTVTAEDGWAWTFPDLPKYRDQGTEIVYTITEEKVEGYTSVVEGFNVTNTYEPEKTNVSGSKTWADADDQDGLRPESITVNLLADGTKINSQTVTAADGWAWSFSELPKYRDQGTEIVYTVTEDTVGGYTAKVNGYDITNTHSPETITVNGTKTWTDEENQDGLRPESITINLLADEKQIDSKTVTAEDGWAWSFSELPKYRDQGTEIVYTIEEGKVNYYSSKTSGYNVENTHSPFHTSIKVIKKWEDADDQDGLRPESVSFILVQDGVKQLGTFELNEGNNWTYENNELPRRANGKDIVYSVEEIGVNTSEYTPSDETVNAVVETVQKDQTTVITITNTHIPETVSVSGTKTWTDADDQDGLRPESITINLLADSQVKETKTVTAEDGWSWSFTDLPKYRDQGTEIVYAISENAVGGYTTSYDGYNVENVHIPETTSISGVKTWNDAGDQDGLQPTSVTIALLANGTQVQTASANIANGWTYSFSNLPKKEKGVEIEYSVKELNVPQGYTSSNDGNNIINTHIPETIDIPITKIWHDNLDQDGLRPESITIYVKDGEEVVRTETISGEDSVESWNYTVTGLPKYKNHGTPISYTITEAEVADYTGEVNGTVIENTHITEKVNVPITKTWVDSGQKEYRPGFISITLTADGEPVEGQTVTVYPDEKGNWSYTFEGLERYKNHGKEEIEYSAIENDVDENYVVSYPKPRVIVNTISDDLTKDIPVTKIWNDNFNQDGKRPESIELELIGTIEKDGKPEVIVKEPLTLSGGNNVESWNGVFEKQPIFHEGTLITYNVKEVTTLRDYQNTSVESTADGFTITNTHEIEYRSITAEKSWDDEEDQDGKRPESVTIILLADGEEVDRQTITAEEEWKVTFENKPVYAGGNEINYTVTEAEVDENYTIASIIDNVITNKHTPETISYKVIKNWKDYDNQDGERPTSITVRLYANETEVQSVEITEDEETGEWSYEFTNLPKYEGGVLIDYTITEDEVDLYNTLPIEFIKSNEDTKVIVNTITNIPSGIPYNGTGIITVNKYWDDENDKYKKRPNSITVKLLADEEIIAAAELSAENEWSHTFTGLRKYRLSEDGTSSVEIVYTIQEVEVEDYETTIDKFNITNKYNGEVPEIIPPRTGVVRTNGTDNNVLIEFIITLLSVSYTVVVMKKVEE